MKDPISVVTFDEGKWARPILKRRMFKTFCWEHRWICKKKPNPRQESFTTSLRRRTRNIAAVVTTIFLLLLIVGTGLGIIDGETLSALKPLVEELVENQASFYNLTDSGF